MSSYAYDVEIDTERPFDNDSIENTLTLDPSNTLSWQTEDDSDSDSYSNSETSLEDSSDEEVSVLYSMEKRPFPGMKQLCEVPLNGDDNRGEQTVAMSNEEAASTPSAKENTSALEHQIKEDPEEPTKQDSINVWFSTKMKIILVVLILALIMTITLTVLLAKRSTEEHEQNTETTLASKAPEETEILYTEPPKVSIRDDPGLWTASPTPTSYPSTTDRIPTMYPTAAPSAYPTSTATDTWSYLLTMLSHYTKREYLLDASRPQGRAFLQMMMDNSDTFQALTRTSALQTYSVLTLYYATSPKTWDSSFAFTEQKIDVCSWQGVIDCRADQNDESVVGTITVSDVGLEGTIPEEICLLEHLERLDLRYNQLSGVIPECLVGSNSLKALLLDQNMLTGYVPSGMLLVPTLEEFEVSNNRLLGDLESLIEGTFVNNVYRYGETWRLKRLNFANNLFTGEVPAFFGALGNLKTLTLHGNDLRGEIDAMLCERTSGELTELTADCLEVICSCCTTCY